MTLRVVSRRVRYVGIGGAAVVGSSVASAFFLEPQVVSSVGVLLGVAVSAVSAVAGWAQVRQAQPGRAQSPAVAGPAEQSVAAPVGNTPATLRGRDAELSRLRAALARPSGPFRVLAGLGGVGKSALALALHTHAARRRGRPVWWISARTPETFVEGLVSVAISLGATTPADADAIRAGTGHARDRFWELLGRARRGWLLIVDDADDLGVLGTLDGRGWLRRSRRGLIVVTSRVRSRQVWGRDAEIIELDRLGADAGAQLLLDLARAGSEAEARSLARHLGGLPLALRLAGSALAWEFSRWDSFRAYQRALESEDLADVLDGGTPTDQRQAVTATFELSLESLRQAGFPQATPLLRLLSCFAPDLPVPVGLLACPAVHALLDSPPGDTAGQQHLHAALRELARLSLITEEHLHHDGARTSAVSLHPLVSETNRGHLRRAGDPSSVRTPHEVAVETVAGALGPLRPDDSRTWPLAATLVPHVRQLLATSTPYLGERHGTLLLDAAARLVAAGAWSGDATTSEQLAADALARTEPLGDHVSRLALRTELAWARGRNGRWDVAQALLTSVLDAWTAQPEPPPQIVLDVRHKLAWSVGMTGDWALARAQLTAVREQRRSLLGDNHPDTLHTRCCLSWALWRTGSPDEAEAGYRAVIADRRAVLGDDHVEVIDAYHSLAEGYVLDGRHAEAEAVLRQVIDARGRLVGSEHPETLDNRPRYWLARALRGQGRDREANRILTRLVEQQSTMLGADHPATVATRELLSGPDPAS
ncbi:tetratricopeptide repeat protein [Micromonospora rosaria]|uniref:tetratricopeptide repeat protein n=1 Tax=Micromonospora rosaria TaxID=47874 RepID=UPI001471C300|nr:tetratricopeptide repeat protein [Micromonospora rosaria]